MSVESMPNTSSNAESELIKKSGRYMDIQLELLRRAEREHGVTPEDIGDFEHKWVVDNAENFEMIIIDDPTLLDGNEISVETLIKVEKRLSEMRGK